MTKVKEGHSWFINEPLQYKCIEHPLKPYFEALVVRQLSAHNFDDPL